MPRSDQTTASKLFFYNRSNQILCFCEPFFDEYLIVRTLQRASSQQWHLGLVREKWGESNIHCQICTVPARCHEINMEGSNVCYVHSFFFLCIFESYRLISYVLFYLCFFFFFFTSMFNCKHKTLENDLSYWSLNQKILPIHLPLWSWELPVR